MVRKIDYMKSIYQIRRDNLTRLSESHGSQKEFAVSIGKSESQLSQLLSTKNIGDDISRHVEKELGLADFWMDNRHDLPPPGRPDKVILRSVIAMVDKALADFRVKVSVDKKSDLVCDLYDLFDRENPPSEEAVRNLLRHMI